MLLDINKIHNGDCLELMKDIPCGSVDMILCDLPYGTTQCKWDTIIPFDNLWEQYERIIKDNGAIVLFASQPFTSALVMSNPKLFKYSWIWKKSKCGNFMNAKSQPLKYTEDIIVFSKKKHKYFPVMREAKESTKSRRKYNFVGENKYEVIGKTKDDKFIYSDNEFKGMVNPMNIIEIPNEKNTVHPTQKPVALFEYLIRTYTNEGDTILDNCLGSGTTVIATINVGGGRNWIGIEKEPEYVDIANKRIEKHIKNLT